MAYNTVIQQGYFTSTGNATNIVLSSGVDWMEVYNWSNAATPTNNYGVKYYWQAGMPNNDGFVDLYQTKAGGLGVSNTTVRIDELTGATGFTYVDSSINIPGNNVAITAISTATPPLVSTASTAGLSNGSIVRLNSTTGALQFGGLDFTVNNITANTSFALEFAPTLGAAATAGNYSIIAFNPLFYPNKRIISNITQAAQAVVTLTVAINSQAQGWQVGQTIRFVMPAGSGMTQLDGVSADIVAVNYTNNTITVDVNTTSFSAFTFPTNALVPVTPPQVIPYGETANTAIASPNLLDDSVINTGFIGMQLGGEGSGTYKVGPAGANGDLIYWRAGKSFNNYVNQLGS